MLNFFKKIVPQPSPVEKKKKKRKGHIKHKQKKQVIAAI